ncbi:MAG: hypothetical protein KDA61_19685 [Planctomycetales bacterium]|nr:hypothetical protein [Planctomycetales bacterium]
MTSNWNLRFADPELLKRSWKRVKQAGGAPGVDLRSVETFADQAAPRLHRMAQQLARGGYRFSRLRTAFVPKPSGAWRRLGIPTVADRVVLQAMRLAIEPLCETQMLGCSYGYRHGRGAHSAIRAALGALNQGYRYVFESDVQQFFDSVGHASVLSALGTVDAALPRTRLVTDALQMSSGWRSARRGIPQGSPLSPLLANAVLTAFDRSMQAASHCFVRYADDFAAFCRSRRQCAEAQRTATRALGELGLGLNLEKTRTLNAKRDAFEFLGFEFCRGTLRPTARNVSKLQSDLERICRLQADDDWQLCVGRVNALLRSFRWYYHFTDASQLFGELDEFAMRCLKAAARRLTKTPLNWQNSIVSLRHSDGERAVETSRIHPRHARQWNGYGS